MSLTPIKAIPLDCPLHPLPLDYHDLTQEGQRQARVNAARQWSLEGTAAERARRLINSLNFFDLHYLADDVESLHEPGFYDMPPLRTPAYHWEIASHWVNPLSITLAPRGGAKSTFIRKDVILRMVSMPRYSVAYATSTNENALYTGQLVKDQCYENGRIQADFAPEWDASTLKPNRGAKSTGVQMFFLNNGSWLRCVSARSRLRGLRPRIFKLDDPEYDESGSTSMDEIRAYMERLLFSIAMPMTLRANTFLHWVGTFVSKRHYLWQAMDTVNTPEGPRAVDPRFDLWSRLHIRASWVDEQTGRLRSCWPEMWPADEEEKVRLKLPESTRTITQIQKMLGSAVYNKEMLGLPGTSDQLLFKLDADTKGTHAWWLEEADEIFNDQPLLSRAKICFRDHDKPDVVHRLSVMDFLAQSKLFMTVDSAFTETATSDRRVSHLMALYANNILFSLDLWSDRKTDGELLNASLIQADKWRCPIIFVEVVRESIKLYIRYRSAVQTRVTTNLGLTHTPLVKDLRPGAMTKTAKISTMDTRFEFGLVKLPLWRRGRHGPYTRLFEQIESFNPSSNDGGLANDDEIDTLSMSSMVIRGKHGIRHTQLAKSEAVDALALLRQGKRHIPGTSIPLVSALPHDMITTDLLGPFPDAPDQESVI
ncbi:MAG: hypothetical protein ACK5U7_16270 [Bacteroidota bacterium]